MKKHLTRLLHAFIFCFCFLRTEAQYVTIPDTNFVNFLNATGYASCMSGNMMDTTCGAVVNATFMDCNYDNIYDLEGIQYFDNLSYLTCRGNQLTSLPSLPNLLTDLRCSSNQLTSLPSLPNSLTDLRCYNNQLTSLPSLPNLLTDLHCYYNQLTSLPSLPNSLPYLHCYNNQLTSLPLLPNSLTVIYCYNNQLTSLPSLPNSLTDLYCSSNLLTSLPSLPNSLTDLHCNYNQLTSLPSLPNSLTDLYCYDNQLTSLPSLPNSLTDLSCYNNQLTTLPSLPNSLTDLHCSSNLLTSLPSLPNSLTNLYCYNNQLTSLPSLPNSLTRIICYDNQLTSLPSLPNSLTYINCDDNQLTSLTSLPDSIIQLYLNNNPALTCLPKYKRINNLYWSNTGITCLPNAGTIGFANPSISNLPLCQPASGCDFYWNIFGRIYEDGNGNCTRDSGEMLLKNIPVTLDSAGITLQSFLTNTQGYYSFETGLGTYQISIDTTGLPFDVICPATGEYVSTLTVADSLDEDLDFGLQCKPGFDVGVTSIVRDSGVFRPANFAKVKITAGGISNFFGVHCAAGISGAVEVILSGPVSFMSAVTGSLVPFVSGDTLLYSIADFGTVNSTTDFRFIVQTDTSAILGSQICFSVNVTPVTGDLNAANNSLQHCFTVVNSFDPNNKEVFPEGNIDSSQHWLTYIINFQNTGTAPAQHIYILDTLDTDMDAAAFTFLSSSHDAITQMLSGNILRFSFPNINLPDSVSDEPNSHGYVQYKVNLKNGLPFGTVIENTAYIFFDFNAPVQTNTVVTEIVLPTNSPILTFPGGEGITLYPNPATDKLNLILKPIHRGGLVRLELYDMTGRKVFSQQMLSSASQQIIRLPDLSSGLYNCVISLGNERINKKIALLRK